MFRSPLCRVVRYIWLTPVEGRPELPADRAYFDAERWWPPIPGTTMVDGVRCIVVGPEFEGCREPDLELLECGHEQPVRTSRRVKTATHQYYNRRRRCDQCAATG